MLAVLMLASMPFLLCGCPSSDDDDFDMSGAWRLIYDWNCDGSSAVDYWHISDNGTFTDEYGGYGTWGLSGDDFRLDYSNADRPVYLGTLSGDNYMSGSIYSPTGSYWGCWNASR
jgi:hypothetical protein